MEQSGEGRVVLVESVRSKVGSPVANWKPTRVDPKTLRGGLKPRTNFRHGRGD